LLLDPAVDLGNESQAEYQLELVEVDVPSATCAQLVLREFAELLDILRRVSFIWVYMKKPSPLAPAHAQAVKVNLSIEADLPAFSLRIAAAINAGTNNRAEEPERLPEHCKWRTMARVLDPDE
jgi:hypothetical protein